MSLHLDVSPQTEARFTAAARQKGIDPAAYFEQMVSDHLPQVTSEAMASPVIDAENAAVIALMDEWLADAPTDPEEIRRAQSELDDLMQNLNKNRIDGGEAPLFS